MLTKYMSNHTLFQLRKHKRALRWEKKNYKTFDIFTLLQLATQLQWPRQFNLYRCYFWYCGWLLQQLQTSRRRACSLVVTRASVVPMDLGLSPRIPGFNGIVLSEVGDVPIDSEVLVSLSISSRGCVGPVFKGAHRGRVYVHAFIWVSERALWASALNKSQMNGLINANKDDNC